MLLPLPEKKTITNIMEKKKKEEKMITLSANQNHNSIVFYSPTSLDL